jgi:uncharacterized protein (DUF1800 family)
MQEVMMDRRTFFKQSGLVALSLAMPAWLTACGVPHTTTATLTQPATWEPAPATRATPTAVQQADFAHLLNRITYGPRPGDLEQAAQLGWDQFIERQLNPETIDDSRLEQQLGQFTSLGMNLTDLAQLLQAARQQKRDQKQGNPTATPTDEPDSAAINGKIKPGRVVLELQAATLLRAIRSECQLYEIMVDFWSNHFNIYIEKGLTRVLKTADDRDVIRAHALGKFRDLLIASAKSPAMLVYLDNAQNTRPRGEKGGINENYARELMELHTVGVDAGYTQDDVVAVARVLTGWTVAPRLASDPGMFWFARMLHDGDPKEIAFLKLSLPAGGGLEEGETLLARLAEHPATAQRIARKLVQAFVADNPPQALIDRAAAIYLNNDTDIRATLAEILHSEEFRNSAGLKIKLPLRMLVSATRAIGAQPDPSNPRAMLSLIKAMRDLGQPLFGWSPPNGYPQLGAAWITTGGMLARWNTAIRLADNQFSGITADLSHLAPHDGTATTLIDALSRTFLPAELPPIARTALIDYLGGPTATLEQSAIQTQLPSLVGLLLASPIFQIH